MAMITDRDLLIIEPSIFIDAQGGATVVLEGSDATVTGSNRKLVSASSDFIAEGITSTHVIVLTYPSSDEQILEITDVSSSTILLVSRPRADTASPAIRPKDGSSLPFKIMTFERAIDQAQAWVLGALGLVDTGQSDDLDETAITNPADVERMIATLAIARILGVAAADAPTDDALNARSAVYAARAKEAVHQTIVKLDLDGDGVPDATRRIDVLALTRS